MSETTSEKLGKSRPGDLSRGTSYYDRLTFVLIDTQPANDFHLGKLCLHSF
jgi:hypothetical protein